MYSVARSSPGRQRVMVQPLPIELVDAFSLCYCLLPQRVTTAPSRPKPDEGGAVRGATYSQGQQGDQPPPSMTADKWHITMKDGATFDYDRNSHTLGISVPANGTVNITVHGGNINLAAPDGDITFVTNE